MTSPSTNPGAEPPLSPRQTQIVDVAMRIIATQGARRFTVQALAEEVGVTGGAIYRHFENMAAIADAIVVRIGHLLFDEFPPTAVDPIERLRLFFMKRAEVIVMHPHVARLLLTDHLEHACGAGCAQHLQDFKRRTQRFVVSCLSEAARAGALAEGLAPEVATLIVLGAVQALSQAGVRRDAESHSLLLIEQVWAALERLLRGTSTTVPSQAHSS